MKDISNNVKKVVMLFLICFILLITYLFYFELVESPSIKQSTYNRRLWAKRESVIRGSILDRNNNILAKTEVNSEGSSKRIYPYKDIFVHALGYVEPNYGITGLEKSFDSYLIGEEPFDVSTLLDNSNLGKGYDIKTTLDYNVQKMAYDMLGDNKGAVVVINPQTGEIISLVSKPSYDPMELNANWEVISKDDKNAPMINRATTGVYPPGSTFKIITAASALSNIKDIQSKEFKDEGVLKFNDNEQISNYDNKKYGNIKLNEAFALSSNVVFAGLGIDLGNGNLKDTAEKFLFNNEIKVEGVSVRQSTFPSLDSFKKGEIAQSAIGQGTVLATPFQMALIAATIANDGIMKESFLVSEVLDGNGSSIKSFNQQNSTRIIPAEDASVIKGYMREVVENGTGSNAAIDDIQVCGKTGTAEYSSDKDKTHAWFVGFAPMENPKVAIAVIVEDGGTGGSLSAKIAREVIKEALK
ncbi:peptidoglycan D,D-transpeptidase FtsI family protein [Clostridium grantii]|uniref:Cell division protein FtsI/penicillin-binding protein 2 n=1 Tax=Clostridium grantii DSM 8605 TaxID=1121316 RepID=A0A1M5U5S3_9CLOT|nr:penicillin-binding protein 2 [Clostridium grantii]SHH58196.1 Cell division protein FtsI/penicillin-binding protein 2 [Clostridium grantii DSM 8605]